jgi:hypothetical protein
MYCLFQSTLTCPNLYPGTCNEVIGCITLVCSSMESQRLSRWPSISLRDALCVDSCHEIHEDSPTLVEPPPETLSELRESLRLLMLIIDKTVPTEAERLAKFRNRCAASAPTFLKLDMSRELSELASVGDNGLDCRPTDSISAERWNELLRRDGAGLRESSEEGVPRPGNSTPSAPSTH